MDERIQAIRANAQLAIDELGPLSDVPFGLDRDSLVWVEGFIERQRAHPDFDESNAEGLVAVLGSFLGEVIIANAGGEWHWSDEKSAWSIAFPNDSHAFPFVKVHRQFVDGVEAGESIVSFFDIAVNLVATGKLGHMSPDIDSTQPN